MSSPEASAEPTDTKLIERFLSNRDAAAFRVLYRRHSPAVYGLLCRMTAGRESDAADLLQNAWMRAAGRLTTFRGDAQFRTWLTGIALNCYREWRRAAFAGQPTSATNEAEALDHRDQTASDFRGLDIDQLVEELPPHYREVLILHDVEGFTHADIAIALGIEPGTSKSRLARARQLFRTWWKDGLTR